jgi:3-(methylthio)propanoyl-CoA dehydrogenase
MTQTRCTMQRVAACNFAMTYTAPIAEQRFVLETVSRIDDLASHSAFAAATPDLVDAILEGAGAFAEGVWAPTNRVGDTHNPKLSDGNVTMPPGFKDAYKGFIDGGWNTLNCPEAFGGQGLPNALQFVVL